MNALETGKWIVVLAGHNKKGELVILHHNTDGEHDFGFYITRWVNGSFKTQFGAVGCFTSFCKAMNAWRRVTVN